MRAIFLSSVVVALAAGCGRDGGRGVGPEEEREGGEVRGPAEVARGFFEAVRANDKERFAEFLTAKALGGFQDGGGFQLSGAELEEFQIGEERIVGDRAEVATVATMGESEQRLWLLMRRVEADWLVHGVRLVIPEGGEFRLDFESMDQLFQGVARGIGAGGEASFQEAMEDWQNGVSAQAIAAERSSFEALVAVTTEQNERAWKIDVAGSGRPAAAILEEILAGSGLTVDAGAQAGLLARPLDLELRGVSRVEAIARVARAIGLRPVYPALQEDLALTFDAQPKTWPQTFAGPFLVEVQELRERAPHATGSIQLGVRALGLAPSVRDFQNGMFERIAVHAIEDARGRSLLAEEGVSLLSEPEARTGFLSLNPTFELEHLLRDVEVIERLAGTIRLQLPVAVERRVAVGLRDRPLQTSYGPLAIEAWGESTRFALTGEEERLSSLELRFSPLDAAGAPVEILFCDSTAFGSRLQASLQTHVAPAKIELKLCRAETVDYPFQLERIPLARHAEMPEELAPLTFSGAAPVAITASRLVRSENELPRVELTIASSANKDVRTAEVTFVYLDASGRELETSSQTLSGDSTFEGPEPLILAGARGSHDATAFFAPEETSAVQVQLERVVFLDATTWERDPGDRSGR